jgi:transcriptional regulator with XRE-family HTH domain
MGKSLAYQMHSQSIGQRLRHMRDHQNWSQSRLAQELDKYDVKVSISSINRWENDKVIPGPYYRELLCQVFHMDTEKLFGLLSVEKEVPITIQTKTSQTLWSVPHLRNRYFTGHEVLLARLHKMFTSQKTGTITALCGLGGIGKTQVIVEYAYRHMDEYGTVLWVRADTLQTLNASFLMLAHLLNLPDKENGDQQRVVAAVMDWLHTHKRWLLILDNADDLEQVMAFLPRYGEGQTVLTTRADATGSNIKGIEIDTLEQGEGALLMLRRAKLLNEEQGLDQASEKECRDAEHISELLGGLPLALAQVGTYIEENKCNLTEYLSLYQERAIDLLKRQSRMFPLSYPHTVATTWNLSFAQLAQLHPGATDLLHLCAFLPSNAISEAMLRMGCAKLEPMLSSLVTDPLAWNEAIGALRRYSLVRRRTETRELSIHRLVQMMFKETMDAETYNKWAERAVQIISSAFSYPEEKLI